MNYNEFKEEITNKSNILQIKLNDNQINCLYNFMNMLLEKNKVMNLTGITEPKEVILKHFIDSLTIAKYINNNENVIDIGTGAGFPGIPLKIYNSTYEICLLDSLNKRINFLNEVCNELRIDNVKTYHGRAEEYGNNKEHREKYDIAISRAVANMTTLVEYLLPFVKVGGICICMKGNEIEEELEQAKYAIKELGGKIEKVERFNLPNSDMERNIIVITKTKETPNRYPRKAGTPSKMPLTKK